MFNNFEHHFLSNMVDLFLFVMTIENNSFLPPDDPNIYAINSSPQPDSAALNGDKRFTCLRLYSISHFNAKFWDISVFFTLFLHL